MRIQLTGFDAISRMVESGIGLAVLPETAARRSQQAMSIKVIPLMDTWALRHHAICVRNFKFLPAHAQRLVEFLRPRAPSNSIASKPFLYAQRSVYDVRYWHKADIERLAVNVRFRGQSGHAITLQNVRFSQL